MKKNDEEFARKDPGKTKKVYWLSILNWFLPIAILFFGIFRTTQQFAVLQEFNERVIGRPLFITSSGYRIYNPIVFLLSIFKYSFNDYYMECFWQAIPATLICLVISLLVFLSFKLIISSHQKNQHIHGTARWATRKDLEKFGLLQKYGVVCGQLENAPTDYYIGGEKKDKLILRYKNTLFRKYVLKKPPKVPSLICHSGATNTWAIMPTRSGKGVNNIIPTLLNYGVPYKDWEYRKKSFFYKEFNGRFKFLARTKPIITGFGSIVCFDPKAENWEATAGWRSKFSTCLPFNPMLVDDSKGNPIGTVHYNPILEIPDDDEAFAWSDMFGEFFFDKDAGENAFFYKNARDIFSAVIMHVRFAEGLNDRERTFTKVLEVFSAAAEESDENNPDGNCGEAMLDEIRNSKHVHDDGTEFPEIHKIITLACNRSGNMTAKERASVYATVYSELNNFQDPLIEECTSYSDFSVHDFMDSVNSLSLYLIIPYNHIKRISPLFKLLINFIIRNFSAGATNATSQKMKIPCQFILDEFPVLGKFPEIEQNAGVLAGYGVTFFIISQSLGQIVSLYGENHAFLDHCETLILATPRKFKDAKEFCETFGNRSVLLDNISASGSKYEVGYSNISRSSQETQVSLINPDELMKLEFNRCIVVNHGMPYKAKKVCYYEDPRFMYKSFMKTPSIEQVLQEASYLPSNHRYIKKMNTEEKIKETIQKQKEINIDEYLEANYDPFK